MTLGLGLIDLWIFSMVKVVGKFFRALLYFECGNALVMVQIGRCITLFCMIYYLFFRYKGYVFPGNLVLSGVFSELPKFHFRSDDVIVASYPRTGKSVMMLCRIQINS